MLIPSYRGEKAGNILKKCLINAEKDLIQEFRHSSVQISTSYRIEQQFHIQNKSMEHETLFTIYRKSRNHEKTVRMNIDDLSKQQFLALYTSDPFFHERVNVEVEKSKAKLGRAIFNSSCSVENADDYSLNTLKKKSSKEEEKNLEKCKRYLALIQLCK